MTIQGSCAPTCGPISPRIIPIAVWDIDEFQWRRATSSWGTEVYTDANGTAHSLPGGACPGTGAKCVRVVNILGFFIDHIDQWEPEDRRRLPHDNPWRLCDRGPGVASGASFLKVIQLVR